MQVVSLITIHIAVYFNFYKFSSNWLELESKKTTFIISNSIDEKKIPLDVTERITNYLSAKSEKIEFYVIESNLIKESLGLTNLSDMSGLSLPFIFQIVTGKERFNKEQEQADTKEVDTKEEEEKTYSKITPKKKLLQKFTKC